MFILKKLLLFLFAYLFVCNIHAKEVDLVYKKQIMIPVSTNKINRISFDSKQILHIVGDDSKYTISPINDGNEIFLIPKVSLGETIDVYFVATDGFVFDLKFKPEELQDPTITKIKLFEDKATSNELIRINSMLRDMQKELEDGYYVQKIEGRKIDINRLKIWEKTLYRFGGLYGITLTIKNTDKVKQTLDFSSINKLYKNVVAFKFDSLEFSPKQTKNIYLICKK